MKAQKKNIKVIMNKSDHFKVYMTQNLFITLLVLKLMKNALFLIMITVDISWNSCGEYKKFTKSYAEKIFKDIHFLGFYIILCPPRDATSHLSSINQNLENFDNQECYNNKIIALLPHFERSFE